MRVITAAILFLLITTPSKADAVAAASTVNGASEGTHVINNFVGVNTRRVKWCAAFIQSAFKRSGHPLKNKSIAVSGLDSNSIGPIVKFPRRDDLAFYKHSHVGIVVSFSHGTVCSYSGNRSNKVKLSCEPINKFKRFRRPA
jgi:hypothetical protein